jgi:GTP-binding protein LepA
MAGYELGDLVKVSILVNAEPVDALALIVHRDHSESRGPRCANGSRT